MRTSTAPGRRAYADVVNERMVKEIEDKLQGDDTVAEDSAL